MKRTITFRVKLLLAFAVLILLCIGGTWLLFRVLLDRVTLKRKVKELEKCYTSLDDFFNESTAYFEMNAQQKLNNSIGRQFMVFIYNANPRVRYNSGPDEGGTKTWYIDAGMVYSGIRKNPGGDPELIAEHELYKIYRIRMVGDMLAEEGETGEGEREYLDVYGKLRNGFSVIIRTDFQTISGDNRAVTDMLLFIGLVIFLLAVGLAFLFSRRVMKPIVQMSEHAERMAEMDFEARCDVQGSDEIGVLGESLNRLSEQLQETVGELKNANSELQRDLEHREEVDAMRSEFIANVSHELKTPIALIQGYAEGLAENVSDDAESREYYCSVIADEAAKMNRMVQKLMTLNQLEFGGNQVEYERFDIVSLLTGVLKQTEVLRDQKGVKLHYHEQDPVYVWADEYMIEEVVTNYVSNAINHATKSKEIAVSLQEEEKAVRVSVYNTGELIPEDELERIWIKFYKVDKARSREYGGSGIGLSIVKAIMERHHQKYGVINHENGVEFWFELEPASLHTGS